MLGRVVVAAVAEDSFNTAGAIEAGFVRLLAAHPAAKTVAKTKPVAIGTKILLFISLVSFLV